MERTFRGLSAYAPIAIALLFPLRATDAQGHGGGHGGGHSARGTTAVIHAGSVRSSGVSHAGVNVGHAGANVGLGVPTYAGFAHGIASHGTPHTSATAMQHGVRVGLPVPLVVQRVYDTQYGYGYTPYTGRSVLVPYGYPAGAVGTPAQNNVVTMPASPMAAQTISTPDNSLLAEQISPTALRVSWRDLGRPTREVALFLADASQTVLAVQTFRAPPYAALFERRAGTAFVGITVIWPDSTQSTTLLPYQR